MNDFKPLVDAILKGVPSAVEIAAIGVVWQIVYAIAKDFLTQKENKAKLKLEMDKFDLQSKLDVKKFEHQRELEKQKFEYEKLKWREAISLEIAKRHLDCRLEAYPALWSVVRAFARHTNLTPARCKELASEIELWRYSKGGLLAEETTRDAAIALQSALWQYDGTPETFLAIRQARRLIRAALRADMGLGTNSDGHDFFDATAARHRITAELDRLNTTLNIKQDKN